MVVFTGASVEEAIQEGLRELDIPRMKAHITVISREKKGFQVYLVKNLPKLMWSQSAKQQWSRLIKKL